jgi:ParB-like nuclease domain
MEPHTIPISEIVSEPAQHPMKVAAYVAHLKAGHKMDPILCKRRDGRLHIVNGRHRLEAHRLAGLETISAFVMRDDFAK